MQAQSGRPRLLLAGGGTGGHVYPLLAVIEALEEQAGAQAPAADYAWLGSERSEARLVPQFSSSSSGVPIEFRQLDIRFSYRWPTPVNWDYYRRHIIPLALGRPFRQALAALDELRPDALLASGGYVSAPVVWAALQRGVPVALLQMDAVIGLVNAQFCPQAQRVYASTPQLAAAFDARCAAGKIRVAGLPARRARASREQVFAQLGLDPARRLLAVMGGSLGSGAVMRAAESFLEVAGKLPFADKLAVVLIGGERSGSAALSGGGMAGTGARPTVVTDEGVRPTHTGHPVQWKRVDYVDDSPSLMHAADFYLGRAGSSTVAELIDCGARALLIPDPQHADRHQFANATVLVGRGQAAVLDQRRASGPRVAQWLAERWAHPRLPTPTLRAADVVAADLRELLEAGR